MPKVVIDGREIEVEKGTNLIEAAKLVGIQIPHYCYHPRLSVVGQCRMCLVEIEGGRKPVAACTTTVERDGMVVFTKSKTVQESQRAIMEFLLLNHPLDCPICDQAGECGLQDYAVKHGVAFSRFEYDSKRVFPDAERIPLGPRVIFNANRCIQCTRCVRFTAEITKTGELGFFYRGSRAIIGTYPGKILDNPLSECVTDICPVGALTSSKFRFRKRVWYIVKTPSICTGCDIGCNISVEHSNNKVYRYKPRFNSKVNDHWICDYGRYRWEDYTKNKRLLSPIIREKGKLQIRSWKKIIKVTAQNLKASFSGEKIILSTGFHSCETFFLLKKLANTIEGTKTALWVKKDNSRYIPTPTGEKRSKYSSPNVMGSQIVGFGSEESFEVAQRVLNGKINNIHILFVTDSFAEGTFNDRKIVNNLRKANILIVAGWAKSLLAQVADIILPTTTTLEEEGTFINNESILQKYVKALSAPGNAIPLWQIIIEILNNIKPDTFKNYENVSQLFEMLTEEIEELEGLTFKKIPPYGIDLRKREALV